MRLGPILLILATPAWLGAQEADACDPAGATAGIRGRLADRITGAPLQGATITFAWNAGAERQVRHVRTNRLGQYSFCDAPVATLVSVRFEFFGQQADTTVTPAGTPGSMDVDATLDAPHARVIGTVSEERRGDPVEGVSIRLPASNLSTMSGSNGVFRFERVPPGRYAVEFSHEEYVTRKDSVEVAPGATTVLDATLGVSEFELAPIHVRVRSVLLDGAGFYERQARGLGTFITREEIAASGALMPSDLLRRQAGIRAAERANGPGHVLLGRSACPIRYIVDGNPMGPHFQADDLNAHWIEGIEIYRGVSTLPGTFASRMMPMDNVACGVIVIWTRDRDAD